MTLRTNTRAVRIGDVTVGGGHPIAIESMTNTDTRDVRATVAQIHELHTAGCEIVRVAVLDSKAAEVIRHIKDKIQIPLIADIHFDHRLAMMAAARGADMLRINPGNIGDDYRVREVARIAKEKGIPIRVGVNGGSLSKEMLDKHGGITAQALAESALQNIALLEKYDFDNIVVSAKASDAPVLIEANKIIAGKVDYPLHLGLTEAGTPYNGAIRSATALGALLAMGIGDTIRVSLAGDPAEEFPVARAILASLGLRPRGVYVIACPTCGRTNADVAGIATRIEARLSHVNESITIAVMGCEVNGPGEARAADVGIAFGRGGVGLLFKKGEVVAKLDEEHLEEALFREIERR